MLTIARLMEHEHLTVGALIITYTILGVPHCNDSTL